MWGDLLHEIYVLNWLDISALATGILYVLLASREIIWCWPVGIINVILFFVIDIQALLYGEVGLQLVYFVLSFYGWYHWLHGGKTEATLKVSKAGEYSYLIAFLFVVAATFGLGQMLDIYTNTDVPYWDAWTNAMSLVAIWYQTRKKIENWLVWIAVDIVYVGLFYYKGFYFSSVLFAFYLIISFYGYRQWKRSMVIKPTLSIS